MSSYVIAWEFLVKPGSEGDFEHMYGGGGEWCKLFKTSNAYVGTKLIKDCFRANRYITLDYWLSKGDYDDFKQTVSGEYQSIDARCKSMTEAEACLGTFLSVED
ncbi:MAG TPA: hypothetical protein V6D17_12920 [Candidatus Obscuribacterales bacterium]